MYNKKYRIERVEELGKHNPLHKEMEGKICYPAYFNVGERGWFLYDTEDWYNPVHRLHTSTVENVEYIDDRVIVTTRNTKYIFKVIDE